MAHRVPKVLAACEIVCDRRKADCVFARSFTRRILGCDVGYDASWATVRGKALATVQGSVRFSESPSEELACPSVRPGEPPSAWHNAPEGDFRPGFYEEQSTAL